MDKLTELRKRVPSLQGLSDAQAIQYLQQRYAPDVPAATIARNLGVSLPEPPAPPAPKRSLFAVANDTVIEAANAAAGTVGSIANFVSPGNRFSQGVDEFIREGEASQSDAVRADKARFRERMEGAQGVGDELAAVGGYIADAPLQALAQAAGSIAVPAGAMRVAGALGGGVKTGLGIGAAVGGAGAGGDAAGTAYQLAIEAGATEEQAQAAARSASLIPAAVGAAGGVVGAERLLAGAKGFGGNAAARALKTGAVEGAQEGLEEGITQYEGQRAAVPFDPTIDPMKGVAGAAAMGAALGGAAGGGVSLLTPASPEQVRRQEADAALGAIGSASSVDEAVALATKATDIPVLPTTPVRDPNSAKVSKARNLETMAWVRDLDRPDQTAALGLMAVIGNPRTPEVLRRSASAQLDALERKARTIPAGEASDLLPTPEVTEAADIPAGEATEVAPTLVQDGVRLTPEKTMDERRQDRMRRDFEQGAQATEVLPTGDALELEPIPTPDVLEEIPAPDAAELLPVGDAAEVLPTGEVVEDVPPLPTGEATDIEPEQADTGLLLTNDGMPYGTLAGARVRAKREGLPADAVVEVQGGWAVKKEGTGERAQPDVAGATAEPAGARDGRGDNAGRGSVAVGSVPAAPGTVVQPAAGTGAGRGQAESVADANGADPALRVNDLSKQWADAVARGDMAEAKRLNDAIVEAKKPAPQAPASEPEPQTREQAIRAAVRALPSRPAGQWMPVTVEFKGTAPTPMLVREKRSNAKGGPSGMQVRAIRLGIRVNGGKREPLVYTFDLSAEDKLTQRGSARPPTDEEVADWEAAGFTMPVAPSAPATRTETPAPVDTSAERAQETAESEQVAAAPAPQALPQGRASEAAAPRALTQTDTRFNPDPDAERERGARERPAIQWADEQGKRLGLDSISAGIGRAVGGLGDVIVDIKSAPGVLPLVAEVRAEYMGRLLESRGVEGDAAIKAAVDEYADKIQQARERMAARVMANERGLPTEAAPAVEAPTNPPEPPQQTRPERLIELRKREAVLKKLLECLG